MSTTYKVRIAPVSKGEFSTEMAYASLDVVTYNNQTYMFKFAKTAGAWDATKVTPLGSTADTADGGSSSDFN